MFGRASKIIFWPTLMVLLSIAGTACTHSNTARTATPQTPTRLAQAAPATAVEAEAKDWKLRVTLLEAQPLPGREAAATHPLWMQTVDGKKGQLGDVAVGQSTPWVSLDSYLKDHTGIMGTRILLGDPNLQPYPAAQIKFRIEVAQGDPDAGGTLLKSMTDTVLGSVMVIVLPGEKFDPAAERTANIELMSEHAQRYLAAAKAAVRDLDYKPSERPRLFTISSFNNMGGQGHLGQLKTQVETLALLGFNTANTRVFSPIPPAQIDQVLESFDLEGRLLSVYNPPSYFDFDQEHGMNSPNELGMNPADLDKWATAPVEIASGQIKDIAKLNGGTPDELRWYGLADEPGWYYPTVLDKIKKKPEQLEIFRAYLREKGLQSADVGAANWNSVLPIGQSGAKDLPMRRLFYWTVRFFAESAAGGFKLAREALERAFKRPLFAPVNPYNFPTAFSPSPNEAIDNSAQLAPPGPDTGRGNPDLFMAGRLSAYNLWNQDWFGDQQAQHWSSYADMLHSAALLAQPGPRQEFGGYLIGRMSGDHPDGMSYKMMSLIGHGAKVVDIYQFAPDPIMSGDSWSEKFSVYRPIAAATRMVGRGERLLYPGRLERGKVAVMSALDSDLWNPSRHLTYYRDEMVYLHYALVHAGYTVDYVDEEDLADGAWDKRGYSALYLTGPNLPVRAQTRIAQWVRGGGTLAVIPGAATADEYNTPTTTLDAVLGVTGRTAIRERVPFLYELEKPQPITATLTGMEARLGQGEATLRGPVTQLRTGQAKVLAKLKAGGAGITSNQHGKGRALTYAFFPGWQYRLTPDRSDITKLPRGWGAAQRTLAVAPARLADTPRPVTLSQEVVEACRLQSDKGIAIVLLNWTDEPITSLTVSVPRVGKFSKVSSLESGAVKSTVDGDTLKLTLPLKSVDVLMIE